MRFDITYFMPPRISLSMLRIRMTLAAAGHDMASRGPLPPGEALALWLSDWLFRRKPVTDEQQQLILQAYAGGVAAVADDVEKSVAKAGQAGLPIAQLAILDATLAALSGEKGFLDLRSGDRVEQASQPPIEVTALDLTALYCLHRRLYLEWYNKPVRHDNDHLARP